MNKFSIDEQKILKRIFKKVQYENVIENCNESDSFYKKIVNILEKHLKENTLSKNGRVINHSVTIRIPILEEGKVLSHYPSDYDFEYIDSKINQLIEYFEREDKIMLSGLDCKFDYQKHFDSLIELNIKNIKKIRGHEGEPCYQYSIYLKSKKIGNYNGYEWFSGDELSLNSDLVKELVIDDEEYLTISQSMGDYTITKDEFQRLLNLFLELKLLKVII